MVHALRGKEYVEWDNPYDVGMTGLIGFSSGYYAMLDCDVLLMLGTDFPYRQFYPRGVGRQMLLQGQLYAADSVSQELFAGSMRLADNRDVVDPGRDEVAAARAAFLEEIEDVLARLVRIGELDAALLEEVLIGPA